MITEPTIAKLRAARAEIFNLTLALDDPISFVESEAIHDLHTVVQHLTITVSGLLGAVLDDIDFSRDPDFDEVPPAKEETSIPVFDWPHYCTNEHTIIVPIEAWRQLYASTQEAMKEVDHG